MATEDQGTLDFPDERLNDFIGSAVAINDAGDYFFRGQFRDFDPDFGSIVLVVNGEVFRAGRQFVNVDGDSFQLTSTVAPQGALRYYLDPAGMLLWAGRFDDPATPFDDIALFLGDRVLLREGVTTFDNVTFEEVQLSNGGELILDIPGGTLDGVRLVEIGAGLAGAEGFALPNDGLNASSWAMSPNGRYVLVEAGVEHPVNGERLMAAVLIDLTPEACVADFNGDGVADRDDVLGFIDALRSGLPEADINGDGEITFADLLLYRRAFRDGCS
ncbi:MAG: GC-type dockerin domain-anchored protein [Pseudomonadota bacterium]